MTVRDIDQATFEQDWSDFRRLHEAALADEHGFLTITSLNWLSAEPQRFADAPGTWLAGPGGVVVDLADTDELSVDGARLSGRHAFGAIPERGQIYASSGNAVIEVARRGGHDIVRPRHPEHPLRTSFAGVPVYPPRPAWIIPATYHAFTEPRGTTVGSVVDDLSHIYAAPGFAEFEIDGQVMRLTAFNGRSPGALSFLFTDATSGLTTYPASRSLQAARPGADGAVTLDFNRAVNLPCAYTDFATCPLPPAENRLPAAIEAGEMLPYERGGQ